MEGLVDQAGAPRWREQLDGQHADDTEFCRDPQRNCWGSAARPPAGPERRDHLPTQIPFARTVRRSGHAAHWPNGECAPPAPTPQFPAQVHLFSSIIGHPIRQRRWHAIRGGERCRGHPHPRPRNRRGPSHDHGAGYALREGIELSSTLRI